jgi:hypothetical protein
MANQNQMDFLTPIGRLVQGSPWILNETDREGKPLTTQDGRPKKQCYFAIAIDKGNPEWPAFWQKLAQVAMSGYPQFFNAQGQCVKADFAWKVADGDGVDADGKPNNAKPGWAGCWVLRFSSSFLPRCFEKNKYQPHQQLQDERTIRPGFFVRVGGLMSANIGSKKAGVYLNADLVELNFVGEEISFGRDAAAALGAQQAAYVPQGAMPLGAGGAAMGGPGGGMPSPGGMPMAGGAAMGGPGVGGAAMPGTQVTPNAGFVAGVMTQAGVGGPGMAGGTAGNGAAMGGPGATMAGPGGASGGAAGGAAGGFPFAAGGAGGMAQQAQPQYQPTPAANGYTLDQFLANGFTVEQCVAQGYFVRVA